MDEDKIVLLDKWVGTIGIVVGVAGMLVAAAVYVLRSAGWQ